jgi:hypothetical protein
VKIKNGSDGPNGPPFATMSTCSLLVTLVTFLALCGNGIVSAGTTPEGLEWLKENSQKEGVVTTSSGKRMARHSFSEVVLFTLYFVTGLQYKVIRSGDDSGKQPEVNDVCLCHYRVSSLRL